MTIKTLRYIHDLLIEDEAKTRLKEKWAREALYDAEDNQKPTADLEKEKDTARDAHSAALFALQEFEHHEW